MTTCNNCGHALHLYKYCKVPITSHGIIHVNSSKKFLMICRRKTLGYVDFMRGRYNLLNPSYIMNLIDEMTLAEKQDILTNDFTSLSAELWKTTHEDSFARDKFNQLRQGITILAETITLQSLVDKSPTAWETQEWGFPKGRRNANESDLSCALREYEEETGYDRHDLILIKNLLPYEEIFTGSNYKAYKHKYFVAFSEAAQPKRTFQYSEVSDLKWFTLDEALAAIRPYNVERKTILRNVHAFLGEFFGSYFQSAGRNDIIPFGKN